MITLNNKTLCENCFSEITAEPCPHCGFIKNKYRHDPATLVAGSVLNQRYMIGGVIGKGGFGITYLAYDLKLDARIAVKEYYPMGLAIRNPGSISVSVSNGDSADSFRTGAEKFYNEAKMVAKFNGNPNIVSVHDFFYENDTVYFVMGYLQGQTLKSYLKQKKITEGQAVSIFRQISNALLASHSMSILHRDVSPDNIMLCDDGTIRLLDFGAARQVMAEQSQSLSVILKQGFAPLEQYQKKGRQGPWTDIYALGATIYNALTGDMLTDPMSRLEDDSDYEGNKYGISDALWRIIHKCTQLKISDRYQDIPELKADLATVGIEEDQFTDVKEEITDFLRGKTPKPADNSQAASGGTPNYTPASDPNATMLLGADIQQNQSNNNDPNATVFLGASGTKGSGSSSNETVAMSPDEAAAYMNVPDTPLIQQQQQPRQQPVMPRQPMTGPYMGQGITGQGFTGQGIPIQPQDQGADQPYAAPAGNYGMAGQMTPPPQSPPPQGAPQYRSAQQGGQPNMTAQYQQRFNQERQQRMPKKKSGIHPVLLTILIIAGIFVIGTIGSTMLKALDSESTKTDETTASDEGSSDSATEEDNTAETEDDISEASEDNSDDETDSNAETPALGIEGTTVDTDTDQGMPAGVYVVKVAKNSGAAKAGIKEGSVIVEIDGRSIESIEECHEVVRAHKVGDEVLVSMMQKPDYGDRYNVNFRTYVTLGKEE